MINTYGKIAVEAVKLCLLNQINPSDAWEIAAPQYSINPKGCPKDMFLCLCAAGLVYQQSGSQQIIQYKKQRRSANKSIGQARMVKNFLLRTWNHQFLFDVVVWTRAGCTSSNQSRVSVIRGLFESGLLNTNF